MIRQSRVLLIFQQTSHILMNNMQKAVIYTRVSTDEQAKNGLSLKGQEDAAREYCQREGIEVAGVFCDAGESAKTTNRPQLIASIAYCTYHFKEVDYYIVWKLDRLARKAYDSAVIDANLQKLGIQLLSVTEPITDSPVGNLTKTMLAGFAQFDNDVRAERSTSGVRRRIEEGGWPHMAPLGYKNFTDSLKRPTLIPTEQAPLITKWLQEYLKGGYTQLAMNQLAWDIGVRSKKGKRLSYQQTCNMLRSPIYAGLVFSKMTEIPIKGLHEGLISVTEHESILDKLGNPKKAANAVVATFKWPLRGGFIKCIDCGESVTGSSSKGRAQYYPLYHCSHCRAKAVGHKVSEPKQTMHDNFEALLKAVTPSEATLKLFRVQVVKKWQDTHMEQRRLQKQLQQELVKLRDRKQRVITLFIDGNLTSQEKLEQSSSIDAAILGTELELKETSESVISTDVLIDFGINMIENAAKLWRIANELERQRLQTAIFPEGLTYSFVSGFGTAKTGDLYQLIGQFEASLQKNTAVVAASGLEPLTPGL
jgi:site-specific DNA recombinase